MKSAKKSKKDPKRSLKWKKAVIGLSIVAGISVPITLLSINWNNLQILYATGSSSVFPLMKKLSDTYAINKPADEPLIDVTCEATGSGAGLEKILDRTASFGNVSFSPTTKMIKNNPKMLDNWASLQIKTITLGIDGIGLVYKGDVDLDINDSNIINIYNAFAGKKTYTFGDLGLNGKDANVSLHPYAKTGGKSKSGTADAFMCNSNFANASNIPDETRQALLTGDYGRYTTSTKESQSETWKQMISAQEVGTIGYLSTGFILQNWDEINQKGFKIATYNKQTLSSNALSDGTYNWRRNLNTLVSLKDLDNNIKIWIDWLFSNYDQEWMKEVYKSVGVTQLNPSQINSMKVDNNLWVDDVTIHAIDSGDYTYGAQITQGGN